MKIYADIKNCFYEAETDYNTWDTLVDIKANTEANARAKMRIYLIENKLMEIK